MSFMTLQKYIKIVKKTKKTGNFFNHYLYVNYPQTKKNVGF